MGGCPDSSPPLPLSRGLWGRPELPPVLPFGARRGRRGRLCPGALLPYPGCRCLRAPRRAARPSCGWRAAGSSVSPGRRGAWLAGGLAGDPRSGARLPLPSGPASRPRHVLRAGRPNGRRASPGPGSCSSATGAPSGPGPQLSPGAGARATWPAGWLAGGARASQGREHACCKHNGVNKPPCRTCRTGWSSSALFQPFLLRHECLLKNVTFEMGGGGSPR